ncbi:MAG: hypothetical protein COA79_17655 [Planctomycetota bacterium]|nr:MAG: hypothetical protein COA79_17655 [Planctomycetota bacterium]
MTENWIEIIPTMDRPLGEKEFEKWKKANEEVFEKLTPDQIRVNLIRGKDNSDLIQYQIQTNFNRPEDNYQNIENREFKSYYENGVLQEKILFVNGKREGEHLCFTDKGIVESKWNWKNGKVHGTCVSYRVDINDGRLSLVNNYKNGLEHGLQQEYFDNEKGNLQFEYYCNEEIYIDSFKMYFPSGRIRVEGMFKDGVAVDEWLLYKDDGSPPDKVPLIDVDERIIEGFVVYEFEISEVGKTKDGKFIYGIDRRYLNECK